MLVELRELRRHRFPSGACGVVCLYRCGCGQEVELLRGNVRSGNTSSCGCARPALVGNAQRTHGERNTAEYYAWKCMRQRCLNMKHPRYKDWGGRGIVPCARWDRYENFKADMGIRPGKGYSLGRINNDLGYSPENCRWESASQQARNRRKRAPYKHRRNRAGAYLLKEVK